MSLNAALNLFLEEYPEAIKKLFAGNSVAEFIRNDIPKTIEAIIGKTDRYLVHGSAGQGNWARVPWVAIFDRLITDTAQDGYYLVYLVKEDFSGVYISLNQGVTTIRNIYGADAKEALRARASDFLARLGSVAKGYIQGPLDLSAYSPSSLGSLYEQGSICAKYYPRDQIPGDQDLAQDLKAFVYLYLRLATKDVIPASSGAEEDDEVGVEYENLKKLRAHKRIERNRKLAEKAKKHHGHTCQACGFNFETEYGQIGKGFIEAHHLIPLNKLEGEKVALDPKKDFAVLCSNCHRMIHKSEYVSEVELFKEKYIRRRNAI
ncbi:MAG: MrcB family domain-containing protein [Sulfuricaulis sp.]